MRAASPTHVLLAASLVAVFLTGCPRPRPEPVRPPEPPPSTPGFSEQALPRAPRQRIEIVGFEDRLSPDKKRVTVSGTLVNRGITATLELRVAITALDANEQVLERVEAVSTNDQLAPGATARFSASLPYHPEIVRYNVQAIAR